MTSFARILPFRFNQFAQRSSEIGILEEFAFRVAFGLINLLAGRILREFAGGEAAREIGGKREPVLSDIDGLLEDLFEAHRTPAIEQDVPGVDGAGDRSRQKTIVGRNLAAVVLVVPFDRCEFRRCPFGVDGIRLPGFGIVDEDLGVAADAVTGGIHER